MLFLLSPAKTLDYESPVPLAWSQRATLPLFTPQASALIAVLRKKTAKQVMRLMDLSEPLAQLNVQRYAAWQPEATPQNSRPALWAFAGDVYEGLQAHSLSVAELEWAQQHLVILSGLYGALQPLDLLQAYRLEMGTGLRTKKGTTLYAYWGDQVAEHLNTRLQTLGAPPVDAAPQAVIVNLASVEYARVALRKSLNARVVNCQFEDWKGGQFKVISFFAKRARGLFARWAVQHRVQGVAQLAAFEAEGYALAAEVSDPDRLVFRRRLEEA
jgi:uncharacterized protein